MSRQPIQQGQQGQSRVAAALQQSRRGGAPLPQQPQQSRTSPPRQQQQQLPPHNVNNNGMRPFQLRQSPAQQGQLVQQQQQQRQPQYQQNQSRPRNQQIPTLQVTVPPPTHAPSAQQYQPVSPSPLAGGGGNRGAPRAAYNGGAAPYQHSSSPTSPFSGSQDTLIGSSEGHNNKYGGKFSSSSSDGAHDWSPGSSVNGSHNAPGSPSIRNLQLVTNHAMIDRLADPENDRLMPATPSRNDFWKRFSTVMHENERAEGNAEKISGSSAKGEKRARSSWLGKENHRQRNYRIWVGVVGFLIIAGIAGGVGYHYATKGESQATTNPTSHDFGLGPDDSTTLPDPSAASSAALLDDPETTDLPAPSLVQPGATLDRRFAPMAQITAAPALVGGVVPVRMGAVLQDELGARHWSRHTAHGHGQKRAALDQLD